MAFQIHASVRSNRLAARSTPSGAHFNPRFREEATFGVFGTKDAARNFNPRFREEATASIISATSANAYFNPRFREEATSRHGENNVCFFVQTAEKRSAFARNKGEWAGKIEISGGFSPVLECEPDGGNDERLWFAPRLRGIYGQVIAWLLALLQRQVRASRGNE